MLAQSTVALIFANALEITRNIILLYSILTFYATTYSGKPHPGLIGSRSVMS